MMKKMGKRFAAAVLMVCLTLSLANVTGAYQWSYDGSPRGKMVQCVIDRENQVHAPYIVQLLDVGTQISFSESVDVLIYAEGAYGAYTPVPVETGVTGYTIPDALNTYIFECPDEGRSFFRGVAEQQAPITFIGDLEYGNATMKLSKPVVDITIEQLDGYGPTWAVSLL